MIDLQQVKVEVLGSQGQDAGPASDAEMKLIGQVHQALTSHPDFVAQYPGAKLSRVEVQRDLPDHEQGKVYLRFEVPGKVPQEFWGKTGKTPKINLHTGRVTVHDETHH